MKLSETEELTMQDLGVFFGFDGKESCVIGKLSLIVRSKVHPKFDLA